MDLGLPDCCDRPELPQKDNFSVRRINAFGYLFFHFSASDQNLGFVSYAVVECVSHVLIASPTRNSFISNQCMEQPSTQVINKLYEEYDCVCEFQTRKKITQLPNLFKILTSIIYLLMRYMQCILVFTASSP